jgi:mannose-6-phosphate isomerase-like protein (cupin superfamily)
MGNRAFMIAGGRAAVIANDDCDFRYSASAHYVPVGVQAPARCHARAETQFLIEDGVVEFMIGGAGAVVMAGDFVRVPAGVHFAYRNAGDTTARLLVRSVNPRKRASQINATFAA